MKILTPPPPPPRFCLVKLCLVAALFLFSGTAAAQTVTVSVTANNGDRDSVAPGLQVDEGDSITYTFTGTGLTALTHIVNVHRAVSGTANLAANTDTNTDLASAFFEVLTPSSTTHSATIAIVDDNEPEGDETIIIGIGDITTVTQQPQTAVTIGTPSSVTVTIRANDTSTFTITAGPAAITETDADAGHTYTVTRTGPELTAASTVVTWTVNHTDTVAADFAAVTGTVSFAAGEDSQTFTVAVAGDNDNESTENFSLSVAAAGHDAGNDYAVAITDNDAINASVTGGGSVAEGGNATVTVNLGATATTAVTVAYTIAPGTATAADYTDTSGGSITINAGSDSGDITVAIIDDDLNESAETFSVTVAAGDISGHIGTATGGGVQTVTIADGDAINITITGPANIGVGTTATYSVDLGARVRGDTTVSVSGGDNASITIAAGERSGEFTVTAGNTERMLVLTATVGSVSGTFSVNIIADESDARARRATVPVASVAQSVGQLASAAIGKRLSFSGGNEFINQDSFALSVGGGGVNLWGSGGRVSANGEVDGVTYDGDTTAWHIGADTSWNDGLLGIAIARTDSETDFTAGDVSGKLTSDITSVHPYIVRNWNDAKIWGAFGYGTGDAELIEADTFNSDIAILSLGGGVTVNAGRNLTFAVDGNWNRAELDGGNANGKTLPKVTADTMRINMGAEVGANFTDELRPFATLNIRRDFGDGQKGGAADYGGGVEWNSRQIHARIEARSRAQGNGVDEEQLSFTLRRTSGTGIAPYAQWNLNGGVAGARLERGRLSVGMEVGVSDNAMEFKNLLSGELRF